MNREELLLLQSSPPMPDYRGALLQSVLVMFVVLGGLALLVWAVRSGRFGNALRQSRRLKIVEQLPLSLKHQIYVVRVDDEELVLGCGEGASPVLLAKKPSIPTSEVDIAPPTFRAMWLKAMGKKSPGEKPSSNGDR